jgi:probable rRNA maturation factor
LLERPRASVSLVLTGDGMLQSLNRDYLETDRPTDVLAFPLADPENGEDSNGAVFLGEIYISIDTARGQARAARTPLHREVAHLTIHGLLHLLGHDHRTPGGRRRMGLLEARLLRKLRPQIAAIRNRRA